MLETLDTADLSLLDGARILYVDWYDGDHIVRAIMSWTFGTLDDRSPYHAALVWSGVGVTLCMLPFVAYELDLFIANIEGTEGVGARLELVDGFGEIGPEESSFRNQLRVFNTIEGTLEDTVTFTNRETGRNWLRFRTRIIATLNRRYAVQASLRLAP